MMFMRSDVSYFLRCTNKPVTGLTDAAHRAYGLFLSAHWHWDAAVRKVLCDLIDCFSIQEKAVNQASGFGFFLHNLRTPIFHFVSASCKLWLYSYYFTFFTLLLAP